MERIGKLHRRAVREGAAIGAASPAADLHELRKTCKKLRYLVEFFHSLLEREAAEAAIASLKGLQDTLGGFQDLQVQADALLGYARELAREGKAAPPTYIALGMLVERLREEQTRARVEFAGAVRRVFPQGRPQELEAAARHRGEARRGGRGRRRAARPGGAPWLRRSSASSSSPATAGAPAPAACRTVRGTSAPGRTPAARCARASPGITPG